VLLAPEDFFSVLAEAQYSGPSAWAWIAETCSVGYHLNFLHSSVVPFPSFFSIVPFPMIRDAA
jgi:hypothetical protein